MVARLGAGVLSHLAMPVSTLLPPCACLLVAMLATACASSVPTTNVPVPATNVAARGAAPQAPPGAPPIYPPRYLPAASYGPMPAARAASYHPMPVAPAGNPRPSKLEEEYARGRTEKTAGVVMVSVGGAAIVGAAALLLYSYSSPSFYTGAREPTVMTASIASGLGGLFVLGIGAGVLVDGSRVLKKLEQTYGPPPVSGVTFGLGAGSVLLSGHF